MCDSVHAVLLASFNFQILALTWTRRLFALLRLVSQVLIPMMLSCLQTSSSIEQHHLHTAELGQCSQVIQQPDGTTTSTYAFSTIPSGSNYSAYQPYDLGVGLTGYNIYPFNETYQAALMNQLHIALDDAGIGHTIYYNSTQVNCKQASSYP